MMAWILIAAGAALMLLGIAAIGAWIGGKGQWFDGGGYDRRGTSKTDRQLLDVCFIALVIAPLLIGAVLIVFGLRTMQALR